VSLRSIRRLSLKTLSIPDRVFCFLGIIAESPTHRGGEQHKKRALLLLNSF